MSCCVVYVWNEVYVAFFKQTNLKETKAMKLFLAYP